MRNNFSLIARIGLAVIALASLLKGQAPATQPATSHRLRFSFVPQDGEAGETDSFIDPIFHKPMKVIRTSILSEADIERVYENHENDSGTDIGIDLTPAGGELFHTFTSTHLHHVLVVILDGKILSIERIEAPIRRSLVISTHEQSSPDDFDHTVHSLQEAIGHSSSQPTGR